MTLAGSVTILAITVAAPGLLALFSQILGLATGLRQASRVVGSAAEENCCECRCFIEGGSSTWGILLLVSIGFQATVGGSLFALAAASCAVFAKP